MGLFIAQNIIKCAIYIFLDNGTHTHTIRTGAQVRTYRRKRTYAHIHTRTRKRMIQICLNENG